jgi:hypothetical protein
MVGRGGGDRNHGDSRNRPRLRSDSTLPHHSNHYLILLLNFLVTGIGEWMCVRVNRYDDEKRLVFGVLDNVPLNDYGNNLTLGTEVAVSFTQIRDHRKPQDFDPKN